MVLVLRLNADAARRLEFCASRSGRKWTLDSGPLCGRLLYDTPLDFLYLEPLGQASRAQC
jgi:hypothetical protein